MSMRSLVLLRHAESTYNAKNMFTGSIDCDLTPSGVQQAVQAAHIFNCLPLSIDRVFCSMQKRAIDTAHHFLNTLHQPKTLIPVCDASLNERDYGSLNGMHKTKAAEQFGKAQVEVWRRSFHATPPEGESLQMTQKRVLHYYTQSIVPHFTTDRCLCIVAHGNSLRGLLGALLKLCPEKLMQTEVGWAEPIVLQLSNKALPKVDVHLCPDNPKPSCIPNAIYHSCESLFTTTHV